MPCARWGRCPSWRFCRKHYHRRANPAYLPIGTNLKIGDDILLEVTQIGKECHSGCAIQKQVGKCIMPRQGIFCRILEGGIVRPGDEIRLLA